MKRTIQIAAVGLSLSAVILVEALFGLMRHELAYLLVVNGYEAPARAIYASLASDRDPLALNNYAVLINRDIGSIADATERRRRASEVYELYGRAAVTGLKAAEYNMGMVYFGAASETRNYETAKTWLKRASRDGDPVAQLAYAKHLSFLRSHPDSAERRALIQSLADRGVGVAQQELASNLRVENPEKAEHYNRLAAAQGVFGAIEALGFELRRRNNPPPDALAWLTRAAEMGSVTAQARLGELYMEGDEVPQNLAQAARWLQVAAEGSNVWRFAQRLFLPERDGFRCCVLQGTRSAAVNTDVSAAYELAKLYSGDKGFPQDLTKARQYFALAKTWADAPQRLKAIEARLAQQDSPTAARDAESVAASIAEARAAFMTTLPAAARERLEAFQEKGLIRPAAAMDLDAWGRGVGGPPDRFGRQFTPELAFSVERTWVVQGEIDLGSEFQGAAAIGLVLPNGAPVPRGLRRDGPLYRMDGSVCQGRFCPTTSETVDEPRRSPATVGATEAIPNCRIDIPMDTLIYAVSAYESKVAAGRSLRGNRPGRIDLTVTETSRPVALYLSSLDSIEWRVGVAPGAQIVGIFATGYYDSIVLGVSAAVPVIIHQRAETRAGRAASPMTCGFAPIYGYRAKEHLPALDAVARAVFGRDIDQFTMSYYAKQGVVIGPSSYSGAIAYSADRGDPDFVDPERLSAGMSGVKELVARGTIRRATDEELLAWVVGYEAKTGKRVLLNGPAHAWMIAGATRLPSHPGGWDNIFILPEGAAAPEDSSGTWAILRMNDFSCGGRDCHALLRPPGG